VVDVGLGYFQRDYEKKDVDGNIALIRWCPWDITENKTQYLRALQNGALAVVFYNEMPKRGIRIFPITETWNFGFGPGKQPSRPIISISYEDGRLLKHLLRRGNVALKIDVDVDVRQMARSHNVVGTLCGTKWPRDVILITAHHDCWFTGANDNTSTVAVLMELARVLSKAKPYRTVRFISFGSEECGAQYFSPWFWINGSRQYAARHANEISNNVIAVFNGEDLGSDKKFVVETSGPELRNLVHRVMKDLDLTCKYKNKNALDLTPISSDHYAFAIRGVSSVCCTGHPPGRPYERYHTTTDVPSALDREVMRDFAALIGTSVLRLANSLFIPLSLSHYMREVIEGNSSLRLLGLRDHARKAIEIVDLHEAVLMASSLKNVSEALDRIQNDILVAYERSVSSRDQLTINRIESCAKRINAQRVKAFKNMNKLLFRVVGYGKPGINPMIYLAQVVPGLEATEELVHVYRSLKFLQAEDVPSARKELEAIYPYADLATRFRLTCYPPRFVPGYETLLPSIDVSTNLNSLDKEHRVSGEELSRQILLLATEFERCKVQVEHEKMKLCLFAFWSSRLGEAVEEGRVLLSQIHKSFNSVQREHSPHGN